MARFLPQDSFKIDVFDGGLNTKNTDLSCPPEMSPDLLGVDFADLGSAKIGPGYSTFCTSLGSNQVDGLHNAYFGGTEYLVASQSALVSVGTAAATAWVGVTGSTGVFTAAVDVCMRTVKDEVYMTNGYATPHRYDGSELFTVGVSGYTGGITGVATVTAAGGSFLPGSYYYGISGENANGVESNVATFTSLLTVATNGAVILSGLPDFYPSSANVGTRYLYRTTAGSQTEYYRVTALTAAQTAFTDTTVDSDLVTTAETDNYTAPKCAFWWYHRGRMFAAGDPDNPYTLYYSQAAQPEIWPAANSLKIGDGDGLPITGIQVMGNSLVVHKADSGGGQRAIYLVYMPDSTDVTDATNWYVVKSPSAYAAAGWKSVDFFENLMVFVSKDGMYAFTGEDIARGPATSQIGQYASDDLSANIESLFATANGLTDMGKVPVLDHDNKVWVGMPFSANVGLYSYDYTTASKQRGVGAWSRYYLPQSNALSKLNGYLMLGQSVSGSVFRVGDTYSANGANLTDYYLSSKIAGPKKHWETTKVWRYLYLTLTTASDATTEVYWFVDGDNGGSTLDNESRTNKVVKIPLVSTSGNPVVGTALWFKTQTYGLSTWATSAIPWQMHRAEIEYLLRSRRI